MKISRVFVVSVLMILSFSCHRGLMREMDEIESLLDEHPDSALTLITKIPASKLDDAKTSARYSLLLSVALDKNYIDLQSDSIIRKAVDYYSLNKISDERMKSWYYAGRICVNDGNFTKAIVCMERAEKDAEELKDYYYLGLINREKASIYNRWINLPAAIECQKKAYQSFELAGKNVHSVYSLYSLGIEYFNKKENDLSKYYITEAKRLSTNKVLTDQCDLRLASISVKQNDPPLYAISFYQRIPKSLFYLYDYGLCAIAWDRAGQTDSAFFWKNLAYEYAKSEADSASLDYLFSRMAISHGDYSQAFKLIDHALDVQEKNTQTILQESLNTALKDYYKSELSIEEEKVSREKERRAWIIIIVGLVSLGIIATLLLVIKRKNEQLQLKMAQYAAVKRENQQMTIGNVRLAGSMFGKKLFHLNNISDEYFSADEKKQKDTLFKSFKAYLYDFRNDDSVFKSLEEDLNKYANGIMDKLSVQFPSIKGARRKITTLFFLGLSYEAILLLSDNVSVESLRMLRLRLKHTFKASGAPDAELFLKMLDSTNL